MWTEMAGDEKPASESAAGASYAMQEGSDTNVPHFVHTGRILPTSLRLAHG